MKKMWEILTTFTEEAQQAGLAKCSELGLDPNRADVSLNESYINLSMASNILKDAITKRKLIQLPLTTISYIDEKLVNDKLKVIGIR